MAALGVALNGPLPLATAQAAPAGSGPVERWGIFELSLAGPRGGNPFIDVELSAVFRQGSKSVQVGGFYDGEGVYKIRFMPDEAGTWEFETRSEQPALNGRTGSFTAVPPREGNHGPVRVRNTFHFAYADGAPYWQLGTTSYAWIHQSPALRQQTLQTLAGAPFNKLRMTIFPTADDQDKHGLYPFEGTPPSGWDFSRFNPAFFRHLENCILQLQALGIEADLILFHPYDRGHFGFDRMPASVDDRYLRYLVARLAAYRNVWWSMANEFDLMREKKPEDWDRYFQIVRAGDPYGRLRSIHNSVRLYDNTRPWVTHASIQNGAAVEDAERAVLYRDVYNKPIVFDEVKYEGNAERRWGQLSPEELVLRFWEGTIAGTYVGHGEIYRDPSGVAWIGRGGVLRGQSPARLAFLRKLLSESPAEGLEPIDKWQDYPFAGKPGQYYLGYFGRQTPTSWPFALAKPGLVDGMRFRVEVIDTWNMTITPLQEVFEIGRHGLYAFVDRQGRSIDMPGRPYMALRIVRVA
jgi:hypothetical protein